MIDNDPIKETLPRFAVIHITTTETITFYESTYFSAPTRGGDLFLLSSLSRTTCHPVNCHTVNSYTLLLQSCAEWTWSCQHPIRCFINCETYDQTLIILNQILSTSPYMIIETEKKPLSVKIREIDDRQVPPNQLLLCLLNQPTRFCFIDIYPPTSITIFGSVSIYFNKTIESNTLSHLTINAIPVENRSPQPSEPIYLKRTQLEYAPIVKHPFETSNLKPLNTNNTFIISPQAAFWSHGTMCSVNVACEQNILLSDCDLTSINTFNSEYTSVQCISITNKFTPSLPAPQTTLSSYHRQAICRWDYLNYQTKTEWLIAWKSLLTLHRRISIEFINIWLDNMVAVELTPTSNHQIEICVNLSQSSLFDKLSEHICQAYFNAYCPLNLSVKFNYALL